MFGNKRTISSRKDVLHLPKRCRDVLLISPFFSLFPQASSQSILIHGGATFPFCNSPLSLFQLNSTTHSAYASHCRFLLQFLQFIYFWFLRMKGHRRHLYFWFVVAFWGYDLSLAFRSNSHLWWSVFTPICSISCNHFLHISGVRQEKFSCFYLNYSNHSTRMGSTIQTIQQEWVQLFQTL